MKQFNKYLNILNIICMLEMILISVISNSKFNNVIFPYLLYYRYFNRVCSIEIITMIVFNLIMAIVNIVKKHKDIAITYIILLVIWITYCVFKSENIMSIYTVSIVLSILNLIWNRKINQEKKIKIPIILFLIFIVIKITILMIPVVLYQTDINNFEKALPKLKAEQSTETFAYKKENEYIFIDDKGNEICKKDYDSIENGDDIECDNNIINFAAAKKDNKVMVINSQGEELFTLCNICNENYAKLVKIFISQVINDDNYGLDYAYNQGTPDANYIINEKILNKYKENNAQFEENKDYEYMYFKNEKILDKILQVVIKTNEKEDDIKLAQNYINLESNKNWNRDTNKIEKFYENKKEYYLIDMNENKKIQLDCNNLIYEAYNDEKGELHEGILLYSNGDIPFFDTEKSGYFKNTGEKKTINTDYLIEDINENYRIIAKKSTGETLFMSTQSNKIERKFQDIVASYNSFFIKRPGEESGKYQLFDKDLKEMTSSLYRPTLKGNHFLILGDNTNTSIYYYNNDSIKLIDKVAGDVENVIFSKASLYNNAEYGENGKNLYYKVGIIQYITEEN